MKISAKSKSWDERSNASKLARSSSSRSAEENELSKLAVRAYGTSCTLGAAPGGGGGVVMGDVTCDDEGDEDEDVVDVDDFRQKGYPVSDDSDFGL